MHRVGDQVYLFNRKSTDISLFYFYPFIPENFFWMSLVKYILLLLFQTSVSCHGPLYLLYKIVSIHYFLLQAQMKIFSCITHFHDIPRISIFNLDNFVGKSTYIFLPQILKNSSIHPKYLTIYFNYLVMHIFLYAV